MVSSVPRAESIRARYVFSVDGTILAEPLENATVRILDGKTVVDLECRQPDVDLGNAAIIPALVNAHTHLEFSTLDCPLPRNADDTFADWIAAVLRWRRQRDVAGDEAQAFSVQQGLQESASCGVQCFGEIATESPWPAVYGHEEESADREDDHQARAPNGVRFRELIGLSSNRAELLVDEARHYLTTATPRNWQAGISPHAPYTVGWHLVESVVQLSRKFRAPLAMHLAETEEELELLGSHRGALVDFLQQRDVWDPLAVPRGIQPIAYLQALSTAHRALIIHGNYLTPSDWKFLAAHADRMSVVYCPRTFHYFGHRDYPLEQMLASGVKIAIGTDSRASNPDLSLYEELKFIRRQHPGVSAHEILKLGTVNGGKALGVEMTALSVVDLPNREAADPFSLLFDDGG